MTYTNQSKDKCQHLAGQVLALVMTCKGTSIHISWHGWFHVSSGMGVFARIFVPSWRMLEKQDRRAIK
jgi:hypothetical protein